MISLFYKVLPNVQFKLYSVFPERECFQRYGLVKFMLNKYSTSLSDVIHVYHLCCVYLELVYFSIGDFCYGHPFVTDEDNVLRQDSGPTPFWTTKKVPSPYHVFLLVLRSDLSLGTGGKRGTHTGLVTLPG